MLLQWTVGGVRGATGTSARSRAAQASARALASATGRRLSEVARRAQATTHRPGRVPWTRAQVGLPACDQRYTLSSFRLPSQSRYHDMNKR